MNAKLKETILNPIFKGNPITVLVLGICSSLAVTVTLKGALVMALSVIAVGTGWRNPRTRRGPRASAAGWRMR